MAKPRSRHGDGRRVKSTLQMTCQEFIAHKTALHQSGDGVFEVPDITRTGAHTWKTKQLFLMAQGNLPDKVLMFARVVKISATGIARPGGAQPGDVEYRFGYYRRARHGVWLWGQYAPFIPPSDLKQLLLRARAEWRDDPQAVSELDAILSGSRGEKDGPTI
jgi:hypothetical protein